MVRLFLTGLAYDQIARQVGLAKGSVVYIIAEFRAGELPIPPDMTEYIDSLREVAVDLRKNNTTIAQAKSCLKLNIKLKEMGVEGEQMERWLEICQDIACPTVSSNQFVKAALELARFASESGLSYEGLAADYDAKLNRSKELDKETEQKNEQLNEIQLKHKEEKERATKELDSITKAMATAQESFQKQKDGLKLELDQYIAQNKLSWEKVKLVEAAVNSGFTSSGLSEPEIERVREWIIAIGSLLEVVKKLESKRDRLQSEVAQLAQVKRSCSDSVEQLQDVSKELDNSISEKYREERQLDAKLESKKAELTKVEEEISNKIENLYISHQVIDFLFAPNCVSNYDLDRFTNMMIAIRQTRLGMKARKVVDSEGNVICECQVPKVYGDFAAHAIDIDHAREAFAYFLSPLVKDKFVSKFEYKLAEVKHEGEKDLAFMKGILEERNRNRLI